jgi:hypothetical protein
MLKKLIIWYVCHACSNLRLHASDENQRAALCNTTLSLRFPKPLLLRIAGDELCQGLDRPDPEVVSSISDYETVMRSVMKNKSLGSEAAHILCYLRRLSKIRNEDTSPLHPISGTKGHNYPLEHFENRTARLLLNIQAEIQNPAAHMLHFFCLSANIYIYAVLREIPLKAPYLSIMVMRLHDAAVRVNFEELSEPTLRKALWMFLVGRLAAHERPEHQWFDEHLLQVVKFCGLDKEGAVRTVVRQLLWPMKSKVLGSWRQFIKEMGILENM